MDYAINETVSFEIKSKHGVFTVIVDKEDWERVSKYTWSISRLSKDSNYFRLESRIGEKGKHYKKLVRLHNFILNHKPSRQSVIDHIDSNPMNNSKANLRICAPWQNGKNTGKNYVNKTGYKGVYKTKSGKYQACYSHKNKTQHININFTTAYDAALARDQHVYKLFGEFAVLNFPQYKDYYDKH